MLFLSVPLCAGETGIADTYINNKGIFVPALLLLVVFFLSVIAGLIVCLNRRRSQVQRSKEYLLRYLTSNLELRKQVPGLHAPCLSLPPEITPQEFTKVIHYMLKKIMFLSFLALLALPLAAQYRTDTATGTMPGRQSLSASKVKNQISLRANLLRWATLTPDLGLEWRIDRRWSVQLDGSWTSWSWDDKQRRYALWNISPAIHYYIGMRKRGYAGVMYHTGELNYKLSATGKQGSYHGGGVTGGYRLPVGKRLAMDFSLGVGYTRACYDRYAVIDHVRVKRGSENKNYWGVNYAGISLVWQLK